MNTVRFNKNAILVLIGLFVFTLCAISIITYNPTSDQVEQPQKVFSKNVNSLPLVAKVPIRVSVTDKKIKTSEEKDEGTDYAPEITEEVDSLEKLIGKIHYENDTSSENEKRREAVKEMMVHAWTGYRKYAWGANELRPLAKAPNSQGIFGGGSMPATIVDTADTLFLMGLEKEYKEARDYIKEKFTMKSATSTLSVFETTIRFLGGLLSLYALTGEQFYMEKAKEVGDALLPAFKTPSGLPKSNYNLQTKTASNYAWASGGSSILSEVGTLHLEFLYLSRITNQPIFEKKIKKVREVLDKAEKRNGLYSNYISADTGRFSGFQVSVGALGDSFYEYLIKSWLQTNRTDEQAKRMHWEASDAIVNNLVKTSKEGLVYTAELSDGEPLHKMGHLACFVVGMYALQAVYEPDQVSKQRTLKLAEDLGKTCHESYIRAETGIGPEMFYFNNGQDATSRASEHGYIQRPEVIEGWFYLWRITKNEMYREWVWAAIQAINKHCRVENGFVGLRNVYDIKSAKDDVQQSFFLAETLKYAYLTFADESLISLDKWVFNTEAHPLPILSH